MHTQAQSDPCYHCVCSALCVPSHIICLATCTQERRGQSDVIGGDQDPQDTALIAKLFFSAFFSRCNTPATENRLHNRALQQKSPTPLHFHLFVHWPHHHHPPLPISISSSSCHQSCSRCFLDHTQTENGTILVFLSVFTTARVGAAPFTCVYSGHKWKSCWFVWRQCCWSGWGIWQSWTKSSVWPAFVLESWKTSFHIGTICTLTSDPAQRWGRVRGGGGGRESEREKNRAPRDLLTRNTKHSRQAHSYTETENMLAQADDAHMHTNCYFFAHQTCGPEITHASVLLSDRGWADLAEGSWECLQHAHRLVISPRKRRRTWSICCYGARRAAGGWVGGGELVCVGRELDISVLWLFVFTRHSFHIGPRENKGELRKANFSQPQLQSCMWTEEKGKQLCESAFQACKQNVKDIGPKRQSQGINTYPFNLKKENFLIFQPQTSVFLMG